MKGNRERQLLWVSIWVLMLFALLEGFFLWVISPRLQIRSIRLDSDLVLNDQWIYEVTGLDFETRYLVLQEKELEEKLTAIPQIATAVVKKRFPSSLDITIRKRVPVALIWLETPDNQELLAVDREGIFFPNDQGLSEWDLPVINGLQPGDLDGEGLDSQLILLLKDLEDLKVHHASHFNIISEVRVIPLEGEGYSFRMHLTTHRIAAHTELPLDREKMEKIILVLDVLEEQGKSDEIGEVDIRMGSIRYRNREV